MRGKEAVFLWTDFNEKKYYEIHEAYEGNVLACENLRTYRSNMSTYICNDVIDDLVKRGGYNNHDIFVTDGVQDIEVAKAKENGLKIFGYKLHPVNAKRYCIPNIKKFKREE